MSRCCPARAVWLLPRHIVRLAHSPAFSVEFRIALHRLDISVLALFPRHLFVGVG